MTFHAYRDLHHRAMLHARQGTLSTTSRGRATQTPATRVTVSSSSSSRLRESATSVSVRSTSTSISSTTSSSRPVSSLSSSSLLSTSQTSRSQIVLPTTTSSTSSSSSVSSSVTAQAAASTTRKNGSLAGIIIGILVAILVVLLIIVFIFKRVRKRRNRVDEARFFNKDKLERPGMVQGFAAGPGVSSLHSVENEKDSQSVSRNIERSLPGSPYPFDTPQHQGLSNIPPSPYGPGDPVLHSESSYGLNGGQQEWGAPPIPGANGPAPYSPYMATFPHYARTNHTTPPGSPFGGGHSMQNPFTTPSGTDTHPSTPTSAWAPHTPMGASHFPLLPGGAFANDSFRDSGYSAAYSEVHVGQAYKVQVGLSKPTYEDLTTTTTRETPGSPPPPFTPFNPAAADPAYVDPAATVNDTAAATHKSLPPRPLSTHTIYNPDDAYGGV